MLRSPSFPLLHHRRLARIAALCLLVPLLAVMFTRTAHADSGAVFCGPGSGSNGSACVITPTDATHLRIDEPFVAGPSYEYRTIRFQPGDQISLDAGGCVQTGGIGDTWKRLVNPSGSHSGFPDGLYWAWVTIPGAFFADNPAQPVTHVPFVKFVGAQRHSFIIPKLDQPSEFTQPLDLIIGYTDDDYSDNSYQRHDDGNDNQCAYDHDGGPAWVNLAVQHGVPGPYPATHPKPFDLVPGGFDSNLLFKNPAWGWQVNGDPIGTSGNFYTQCHAPVVPELCTNQTVSQDHLGWDLFELIGLCGGDPPLPHVNWFDVTSTGKLSWDEWDSGFFGDDDYNMTLKTPDVGGTGPAGATSGNTDGVKMEFDAAETVKHFDDSSWWGRFHYAVEHPTEGPDFPDQMINGHDAVVVGLMGIDAVHEPGGAELHPVHVLAVRENSPGGDPAYDQWAIFARNWGNEGECGSQQHYLDSNTITLDLPRPANAPAGATAAVGADSPFYAHGTDQGPAVHNSAGGVQVTFTLPNGDAKGWEAGELHLNWTGAPVAAQPPASRPPRPAASKAPAARPRSVAAGEPDDPEEVLRDIHNAMTPTQRADAAAMFDQLRPPTPQDSSTPVAAYLTSTAPTMPARVPTVSEAPDPVSLQRLHAQFQSMCAATGGNLPTQPTWCPTLNQPPVTTLTTTGGIPGLDGWLTTPVTATLTGHDAAGTGIGRTEYSYDNQTWFTYTSPVALPQGAYTLTYRSVDNKGNVELAKQHPFKIDTVAPVTTAALSPGANPAGWIAADGTVTLHAGDATSGVAAVTYSTSGAQSTPATTITGDTATLAVHQEGVTVVTFHATDRAGNAEADRTLTVRVDKTPPTSGFTTTDGTIFVAVILGGTDTQFVTGTAVDAASGVDHVTVTFTPELLGQPVTATATVICADLDRLHCSWKLPPPRGIGHYRITVNATDRAGNVEATQPEIHITVIRLL